MNSLRDLYVHEQLQGLRDPRRTRNRAPGDEGPRRPLVRQAARLAGHVLVGVGARLLAFGGEQARGQVVLAPYLGPTSYSRN